MDVTHLLFFFVAIIAWFWRWKRSAFVRRIDLIPGPPCKWPFLGNLLDLPHNGHDFLHTFCSKWVKEYGPVYRIWRGLNPMVVLSSPQALEAIMSSQKNINKSILSDFIVPWLGRGLLLSNGEKWRGDRRLLTPAFHFQILYDFFDVFNRKSDVFIQQIEKKLMHIKEVEISEMASLCTLDIICEAAMGINVNCQEDSANEYIQSTDQIEQMLQTRINSTRSIWPDWIYFHLFPHGRQIKRHINLVHNFTEKVLLERRSNVKALGSSESKKRRPFLDLLLETTRMGVSLSDAEIINQVDTFMFAGHDTISTAITWFLYCMATHPHEQDRVYQEIYDCFGDSDRPCMLEDLPQLKYLECCIKETMRRHPSVPFIRRQINEEVTIHGHSIPVGTTVQLQIYSAHHNREHFPDHELFRPERFLPEHSIGRHPYCFVPFSAGPRNCIGQKFATYETKVVLTNLLRKFRFDIDPRRVPVRESMQLILKSENGMPLIIKPRN